MSATGRNTADHKRDSFDYYATPAWCVERLIAAEPWITSRSSILEPCAGEGAILRVLRRFTEAQLEAWEIQDRFRSELHRSADRVHIGNALKLATHEAILGGFEVAFTNPPFGLAFPLLQALWPICDAIVFLLRLSFLASADRQPFLRLYPPALRVLPDRPSFSFGGSDNCDYAWFIWRPFDQTFPPDVRILHLTPKKIRMQQKAEMIEYSKKFVSMK